MTQNKLKQNLYDIIFGTESRAGKTFDLILIYMILFSVGAVMLDSTAWGRTNIPNLLTTLEWIFTILFTIEYAVRIYCSPKPIVYIRSPYGIIDLISILPTYLAIFVTSATYFSVFRLLRVLRIFRVLRLVSFLHESTLLSRSLWQSRRKIFLFFFFVLILATVIGALMYLIEGPQHGYDNIPKSIYATIVTITTVGYGDITPQTTLGQFLAAFTMLLGYSIIAVPTGIITAELAQEIQKERVSRSCPNCNRSGHEADANYCRFCGSGFPSRVKKQEEGENVKEENS